jgi:hypothetical protein
MEYSYESREEALSFITNGKFDYDENPSRLRSKLISTLISTDKERFHAINSAPEYLAKE